MSAGDFVHLHVHTDYSTLDGLARPEPLVAEVARLGMSAVANTDHGNASASYHLYTAAKNAGIKSIIGQESYLTPGVPMSHKAPVKWNPGGTDDVSGAGAYTHMTMWAENNKGLHNLFQLSSTAWLEGYYQKPRADLETVAKYAEGLIATTGCPSGEVQTWLRIGDYEQAKRSAGQYAEIFGPGNFFVEVMDHGLDIEQRTRTDLLRLSRELNLPLLATNDSHYVTADQADAHDILLCIGTKSQQSDQNRFRFSGSTYYIRPAHEMRELFRDIPEACDNTLLIADRANVTFEHRNLMPNFPVPDGHTEATWFTHDVQAGLNRRFPAGIPSDVQARAEYETNVILQMGFPGYFLIVADFVNWAKANGVHVGPARGSVGGSLVAYALGITELDPVRFNLMFERFLNPERVSMPDIDIDFDDQGRGRVMDYVINKYGSDKVAQIVTFATLKARNAMKDSARVLGYPYSVGDTLAKAYPLDIMGKPMPLADAFNPAASRYSEASEFRDLVGSNTDFARVVNVARTIEGTKRGTGVHAAGVIMSSESISATVPLMRAGDEGRTTTQFEFPTCEELGLIKMDFLGLANLTIIADALTQIRVNRGVTLTTDDILADLSDANAYKLLQAGDTLGVFQLDSGPMRALLRSMAPTEFADISAVLALYRPGPMSANAHNDYADRKNKRKPTVPIHPELQDALDPILGETHSLVVYQEQVMEIAQKLAGFTLGGADLLRRAMGKKKKEILDKEFVPFRDGMRANGYSDASIQALWDVLVPFSGYAFNKAHTAGYGMISYVTAYLKANYPAEYMAALLTSVKDNRDKSALYLAECRRMGLQILPPDVNSSVANFTATGDVIRYGLAAVKGVGEATVESILDDKAAGGPYTGFMDFVRRAPVHKRSVEPLIAAGAFDVFGHPRAALMLVVEQALAAVKDDKKNLAANQDSLFADAGSDPVYSIAIPNVPEWDERTRLSREREMLGAYVSGHPLHEHVRILDDASSHDVAQIRESVGDGRQVSIAGLVTMIEVKTTKNGDMWAKITVEDLDAAIEVLVFQRTYAEVRGFLAAELPVIVSGRVQRDDTEVALIADGIKVLDPREVVESGPSGPLQVDVNEWQLTTQVVADIRQMLAMYPGEDEVRLIVTRQDGTRVALTVGAEYRVRKCRALRQGLSRVIPV